MRAVAGNAAFLCRVVGKDEGTGLRLVALVAGLVLAMKLGAATLDRVALVGVMAIAAGHLPGNPRHLIGQNRMGVRQHEFRLLVHVALEAGLRVPLGIDDRARGSARLDVLAAGAVAGFASHVAGFLPFGHQPGVIRCPEVLCDLFVTLVTTFGTEEGCACNERWGHHRPAGRGAGDQDEGHTGPSSSKPQNLPGQVAGPTAQSGPGGCSPQMFHEC